MGDFELLTSVSRESSLRYHPQFVGILTCSCNPAHGQSLVGSLTGAVASKKVTEALKGFLNTVGNRVWSVIA